MRHDDWLERQIEDLGRALAAIFAAPDREQEVDHQLDVLVGMGLRVLETLPPSQVVRLIGHRFGEPQPERWHAVLAVLEEADALGAIPDPARQERLATVREALEDALAPHLPAGERPPVRVNREAIP